MPIYEYRCEACGSSFEVLQKFSDAPIETCELCGGGPVSKVLHPVAVHFKGSGFYTTDYGRSSQFRAAASKENDGGDSGTSSEAKVDSSSSGSAEGTSSAAKRDGDKAAAKAGSKESSS